MTKCIIILIFLFSVAAISQEKSNFQYLNETEVGQTTVGGNADTLSMNMKQKSTFVVGKEKYIVEGSYLYATAGEVLTARSWDVKTRIDHTTRKKLDVFGAILVQGNKFMGFYERFEFDLGLKHYLTKPKTEKDKNKFFVELGLKQVKENRTVKQITFNDNPTALRLFFEYSHDLSKNAYFESSLENIGNIDSPGRFRSNFTATLNSKMTDIFTLKLSYTAKYDDYLSQEGFKQLDYLYTTSLLANF